MAKKRGKNVLEGGRVYAKLCGRREQGGSKAWEGSQPGGSTGRGVRAETRLDRRVRGSGRLFVRDL